MGMVYYTLISGRVPFPRNDATVEKIMKGERPDIDPSWNAGYMEVSPSSSPVQDAFSILVLDNHMCLYRKNR